MATCELYRTRPLAFDFDQIPYAQALAACHSPRPRPVVTLEHIARCGPKSRSDSAAQDRHGITHTGKRSTRFHLRHSFERSHRESFVARDPTVTKLSLTLNREKQIVASSCSSAKLLDRGATSDNAWDGNDVLDRPAPRADLTSTTRCGVVALAGDGEEVSEFRRRRSLW